MVDNKKDNENAMLAAIYQQMDRMIELIQSTDLNNDGQITKQELQSLVDNVQERFSPEVSGRLSAISRAFPDDESVSVDDIISKIDAAREKMPQIQEIMTQQLQEFMPPAPQQQEPENLINIEQFLQQYHASLKEADNGKGWGAKKGDGILKGKEIDNMINALSAPGIVNDPIATEVRKTLELARERGDAIAIDNFAFNNIGGSLASFDANRDGGINPQELASLQAAIDTGRA